jgi:hypothetical protein
MVADTALAWRGYMHEWNSVGGWGYYLPRDAIS